MAKNWQLWTAQGFAIFSALTGQVGDAQNDIIERRDLIARVNAETMAGPVIHAPATEQGGMTKVPTQVDPGLDPKLSPEPGRATEELDALVRLQQVENWAREGVAEDPEGFGAQVLAYLEEARGGTDDPVAAAERMKGWLEDALSDHMLALEEDELRQGIESEQEDLTDDAVVGQGFEEEIDETFAEVETTNSDEDSLNEREIEYAEELVEVATLDDRETIDDVVEQSETAKEVSDSLTDAAETAAAEEEALESLRISEDDVEQLEAGEEVTDAILEERIEKDSVEPTELPDDLSDAFSENGVEVMVAVEDLLEESVEDAEGATIEAGDQFAEADIVTEPESLVEMPPAIDGERSTETASVVEAPLESGSEQSPPPETENVPVPGSEVVDGRPEGTEDGSAILEDAAEPGIEAAEIGASEADLTESAFEFGETAEETEAEFEFEQNAEIQEPGFEFGETAEGADVGFEFSVEAGESGAVAEPTEMAETVPTEPMGVD